MTLLSASVVTRWLYNLISYFGEIRKNWNTMWNIFSVSLTCDIIQKKKYNRSVCVEFKNFISHIS